MQNVLLKICWISSYPAMLQLNLAPLFFEAISLLGEIHLPFPRDSICPFGSSGSKCHGNLPGSPGGSWPLTTWGRGYEVYRQVWWEKWVVQDWLWTVCSRCGNSQWEFDGAKKRPRALRYWAFCMFFCCKVETSRIRSFLSICFSKLVQGFLLHWI